MTELDTLASTRNGTVKLISFRLYGLSRDDLHSQAWQVVYDFFPTPETHDDALAIHFTDVWRVDVQREENRDGETREYGRRHHDLDELRRLVGPKGRYLWEANVIGGYADAVRKEREEW